MAARRFVYVIRSVADPDRYYTGWTANVGQRMALHNSAVKGHSAKFKPWTLVVAIEFTNSRTAFAFERYLKSGSGRAFAKKHFAPPISISGMPLSK